MSTESQAATERDEGSSLRVLVIDDDRKLCRLIREYLAPMGYDVTAVHEGREGLERAVGEAWDAIILDVMLPGLDGFGVLAGIRKRSEVPVLMLTARGEEADRIVGLEMGADDYLPKTFSPREMLARLRAVCRRVGRAKTEGGRVEMEASVRGQVEAEEEELVVGRLRVRPESRSALLGDESLSLTPVEFDLLVALARARGRVRSREALLAEVRERDFDVYDRSIDVHISALRRKLGDDARNPQMIRTYRSAGYMLVNPEA